jgi:hypothetical protein
MAERERDHLKARRRWYDNNNNNNNNNKMDLQEVGWGHGLDCSGSSQGQAAGCCDAVMNLRLL